jgi:hypothetical protein
MALDRFRLEHKVRIGPTPVLAIHFLLRFAPDHPHALCPKRKPAAVRSPAAPAPSPEQAESRLRRPLCCHPNVIRYVGPCALPIPVVTSLICAPSTYSAATPYVTACIQPVSTSSSSSNRTPLLRRMISPSPFFNFIPYVAHLSWKHPRPWPSGRPMLPGIQSSPVRPVLAIMGRKLRVEHVPVSVTRVMPTRIAQRTQGNASPSLE